MWRQTALVFVLSMVTPLGVAATVTHIEAVQASQRAAQAREAQRLDKAAIVAREQLQALQQAAADRDAAQAKAGDLQQQLDATTAEGDKLKDQVAALQAVSYGLGSGPAAQTVSAAGGPVAFPYGYCTYYVATRRLVTWRGNAIDWWWNARAAGRPEGSQPQVGAIQVSRDSWWGHVAFVEAVNGNGSWVVSEMNFTAWGYVDRRTVWPGGTLIGFIY